ncbi:NRAMP family divalent metal transporter [Roseivirga sp. BDSF3-8]|uniref:NRAMP family divalent metal transporter n=1 Tax=Roseivirga sp. BDSF3-8 TaxID=3241598 RepID=UPI003531855A
MKHQEEEPSVKMTKFSGWRNVLFWAVISAAFIGPGTVATAASAGSSYQLSLMWALIFSVFGCVVLQEAASRITIVSGLSLGKAIGVLSGRTGWLRYLVGFSVVFGCAAYQAGNILGAVAGGSLVSSIPPWVLTLIVGGLAAILLVGNSSNKVSYYLGFVVALMGISFMVVAIQAPSLSEGPEEGWLSLFYPSIPEGSELLILGLIGTTIVPYNLFLGSGISSGQTVSHMRQGLIPAIVLGGLFSSAVIVCGTLIQAPLTFDKLFNTLQETFGNGASWLFAIGLFSAGFTSSVTAPLAAGLTVQMSVPDKYAGKKAYTIGWVVVWVTGTIFGLLQLKPVPVILLAQALNGMVLPIITFCIALAVNHKGIVSPAYKNGFVLNLLLIIILSISSFLGFRNLLRALEAGFGFSSAPYTYIILGVASAIVLLGFFYRLWQLHRK